MLATGGFRSVPLLGLSLFLPHLARGQVAGSNAPDPSPPSLNGATLRPPAPGPWSFLAGGHLYGDPYGDAAPARTFVKALPKLEGLDADFFLSLGDCFKTADDACVAATLDVFSRMKRPVFHAIGNHDAAGRAAHAKRFGPTTYSFVHRGALLVILDTERDPWNISGAERELLDRAVARATAEAAITSVFFCGHKVVFGALPGFEPLARRVNAYDGWPGTNDFAAEILPRIRPLARKKPVHWLAGDVGITRSLPLFHHRDPESGITYVATGIGDLDRDLVVQFKFDGDGAVTMIPIPLGTASHTALEDHGLASWSRQTGK